MTKKLHIATAPVTNTIYAGKLLKGGRVWAADKQDVTIQCLNAVAEHARNFGKPIEVTDGTTGNLLYTITVEWEQNNAVEQGADKAEEELLALFRLVHGEIPRGCSVKITCDENGEPTAVALMKGGQECRRATKTRLIFDYVTREL